MLEPGEEYFDVTEEGICSDFYPRVQQYLRNMVTQTPDVANLNNPLFIRETRGTTDERIDRMFYNLGGRKILETMFRGQDMYKMAFRVEPGMDKWISFGKNEGSPAIGIPHNYAELLTDEQILKCKIGHHEFRAAIHFFYTIGAKFRGKKIGNIIHPTKEEAKRAPKHYFVICFCVCEGARLQEVHDFVHDNILNGVSLPVTQHLLDTIRSWDDLCDEYKEYWAARDEPQLQNMTRLLRIIKR